MIHETRKVALLAGIQKKIAINMHKVKVAILFVGLGAGFKGAPIYNLADIFDYKCTRSWNVVCGK
jgi:hypothetical protein